MKKIKHIFFLVAGAIIAKAQTPSTIAFPPTPNPAGLTADSYTRASTSIDLQPGFIYGSVTGGENQLLNLSIGSNPSYVDSRYLGSGISSGITCNSTSAPSSDKPVGETTGYFSVSPSGGALYRIPIIISPGTKGIQPDLSLNYDSQKGTLLAGIGWNLAGLSAIERTSKTPMHDGAFKGVELSNSDVFAIDGNRLFALSGTYGQNGTTYYTESESFATITSYNTAGNGPEKFEVKDKAGRTLKYGYANNSSHSGIGNNSVLAWYLNEVKDEFGNYMLYYYKQLGGEIVIDKIDYTGNSNASLVPYNSVQFDYMPLAEKTTYYINGVEFRKSQLLKSIRAFAGTQPVRGYELEYSWNNGTYLAAVRESDSNGNELVPTTFCWGKPNDNAALNNQSASIFDNPSSLDYANLQAIPADLDGDGFSDYVCYNVPGGSVRMMHNDFLSNMVNNSHISYGTAFANPNNLDLNSYVLSSSVTDIDNDNRQEVFSVVSDIYGYNGFPLGTPSSKSYYILKTSIDANNTYLVQNIGSYTLAHTYTMTASPSRFLYQVGDLTGDGNNDNLRITPEEIHLQTGPGSFFSYPIPNQMTIARPIAFSNDGYRDYILFDNSVATDIGVTVLSFDGSGFSTAYANTLHFPYGTTDFLNNFAFGDVNGDAIDDLVYIWPDRSKLYICRGTGLTFLAPEEVDVFSPLNNSSAYAISLQVTDINGDGKADIIATDNSSSGNNYFSYFSLGDRIIRGPSYAGDWVRGSASRVYYFENHDYHYNQYGTATQPVNLGNNIRADLNGDGIVDFTSFDSPGAEHTITNNANGFVKESILHIQTGLRTHTDIHYANLNSEIYLESSSQASQVYKKRSPVNYAAPVYNYKPGMYCVRRTKQASGYNQEVFSETRYMYSDALMHTMGRGFLGFEQVMSFDDFTKIGTQSKSTVNTQFNLLLNTENKSGKFQALTPVNNITDYAIDNNILVSKEQNSYQVLQRHTSGYLVQLSGKTSRDYLNSTQFVSTYVYDLNAAGNISSSTTDLGWSSVISSSSKAYTYVLNNGAYKPASELSTVTQTGETPYVRSVNYNYDPQGHLTSIVNDQLVSALSNSVLTTTYSQFNSFGLPTKTSISASNLGAARNSEVLYDATGRFCIKAIDALGNFSEAVYEPVYGNKTEEKSITGLTTNYYYDGLGRLIRTRLPNNAQNKVTYTWEAPQNYPYGAAGVYAVKTEVEASGYSKVYYSSNGEVLRTETQDYAGQTVVSDTKYNYSQGPFPCGVVLETTEPHYLSQQKFLTEVYDYETTYFRLQSQSSYSTSNGNSSKAGTGITAQYSFNNQSTDNTYVAPFKKTTDQNGKAVTTFFNSAGQVTRIRNDWSGGQQNADYTYASCGKAKSVALSSPNVSGQSIVYSYSYNYMGQLAQSVDPSLGTKSYVYDALGEVLSETKPSGTFSYQYDVLGRLDSRGGSAGTTNYQYVTSGNGLESIDKIFGPNSSTEYIYDSFGRVTEHKETVTADNKVLKTNYAYDNYGREIKHTYPGGIVTQNTYNQFGHLEQITDANNQALWQLITKDAMGRITEYSYGNGISTKNTYNDLNYLVEIDHGGGTKHKQTYTYGPLTGNLLSRRFDNYMTGISLKDVFNYDVRDQLSSWLQQDVTTSGYYNSNSATMDVIGNITQKSDAGNYVYGNSAKPFHLTQINNATNNISLNTLNAQYNVLDKVSQLSEMSTNKQMDFVYGTGDGRIKMRYAVGGTNQYTRYYGESYEREETANAYKEWTYITAPSGLCAVYHNNSGSTQLYYALSDHLGSPVLLTSASTSSPTLVEEYAFDAWGRRRNPADWSYTNVPNPTKLIRGYTLHEHLDEFGMINMNARIYDPVLGRFIQADDRVTDESNLQTYNIFAYCQNNPLKYTDPTGHETVPGTEAAIAAAFSNMVSAYSVSQAYSNWHYYGLAYNNDFTTISPVPMDENFRIRMEAQWQVYNNSRTTPIQEAAIGHGIVDAGPGLLTFNSNMTPMEAVHMGLDLVGLIDGLGTPADLVNAGLYAIEGDYKNMGWSLGAAAPAAGIAVTIGKFGNKIVGTTFDIIKPTQDWLNQAKVNEYKTLIQNGEKLDPIITYKNARGTFIEDGHHRFAAYMELGIEPNIIFRNTSGPVGYPNWSYTSYQIPPFEY